MSLHTQVTSQLQVPAEEPFLLTVDDILTDDFGHPAADDLTPLWWQTRGLDFSERMTRNAILTKWRCGTIDSVVTLMMLIAHEALDYDLCIELISDHALSVAKIGEGDA